MYTPSDVSWICDARKREVYLASEARWSNDFVCQSHHFQLVRTLEVTQPKSPRRFLMLLVALWQRRPHFTGH